jgi:hypothetical protein
LINGLNLIKPYLAGKNQKCVGIFIPKAIVKKHKIDPSSVLLLITSNGFDDLQLKILREENLIEKEEVRKAEPAGTGIGL